MEVYRIAKTSQLRFLVHRLLAKGARQMASIVDDSPVDLVRHLLVSFLFQIGEGGAPRVPNCLFESVEPHGAKECGIAHIFHYPAPLYLTTFELPVDSG